MYILKSVSNGVKDNFGLRLKWPRNLLVFLVKMKSDSVLFDNS